MLLAMKIKIAITAAALASPVALTVAPVASVGHRICRRRITEIAARPFQYRMAGDFSRDGKPAEAPLREARLSGHIKIMTSQVTSREYARCVDDGGCPRILTRIGDGGSSGGRRELARCNGLRRMDHEQDGCPASPSDR